MNKFIKLLILAFFFLIPIRSFALENDKITLYLFHGDGCPHCAAEQDFLKTIEDKYDNFEIVKYEVWYDDNNATLLSDVASAFNIKRNGVPVTVIGSTVINGYSDSVGSKIIRAIEYYKENEYVDYVSQIKDGTFVKDENKEEIKDDFSKEEEKSDEESTLNVPLLGKVNFKNVSLVTAAVFIGLIDGFNPCAMWILLFLISVLIGIKDRRKMLILGMTFLGASALVYMFIMLSWLTIALKMTTIIWIRNLIALVALIGGIINLRSYFRSHDSGCEVVDDKKRKKIFKRIRKYVNEKSFIIAILGIVGLAVSVNVVELACSAGLPLVFTELLALNNVSGFMKMVYTLLYILFFLIDDLIVFFIAMYTMQVTGISTKYNKYSHLIGGIIMVCVGILLIFKPEWLMFQFK